MPETIPPGFPKDLSIAELDAYAEAIIEELGEHDLAGALDLNAVLLNASREVTFVRIRGHAGDPNTAKDRARR